MPRGIRNTNPENFEGKQVKVTEKNTKTIKTGKAGAEYLNSNSLKWEEKHAMRLARDIREWLIENKNEVFLEKWLYEVADDSLYPGKLYPDLIPYLSHRYKSFSEYMSQIAGMCLVRLKNRGLDGTANANITKFLLSAQFGMTEKTEVINTNRNIEILNIDPLDNNE